MKVASFFAGIGGFDLAFRNAGHDIVYACDIDPFARAVYAARFGYEPQGRDINDVRASDIPEASIWVGGFPCQDLSTAGKRGGIHAERSGLIWRFLELARERRPEWILLENVPGLLSGRDVGSGDEDVDEAATDAVSWFGTLLGALAQLGFVGSWRVLDARFFGVPQRRRRVFILARRAGSGPDPAAVLFEPEGVRGRAATGGASGPRTAGTLTARAGKGCDSDGNGREPVAVAATVSASAGHHGHSSPRGDGTDNLVAAFDLAQVTSAANRATCGPDASPTLNASAPHAVAFGHTQGLDEQASSDVTPTIRRGGSGGAVAFSWQQGDDSKHGADGRGRSWVARAGDYTGSIRTTARDAVAGEAASGVRRLTPRECERLQGFPDDWTLIPWKKGVAPDSLRYKALGNSVAVPVVEWIARRLPE